MAGFVFCRRERDVVGGVDRRRRMTAVAIILLKIAVIAVTRRVAIQPDRGSSAPPLQPREIKVQI